MPLKMTKLNSYKSTTTTTNAPPWEILVLIAHHLDPKTLAIASCVSKSWYNSTSSDHIWHSFCTTQFPSISQLRLTNPLIPYRRLYAMAYTAAKRRVKSPSKAHISLDKLIFVINISTKEKNHHSLVNTAKLGSELDQQGYNGVFRFDIDVNLNYVHDVIEDLKISWNVVREGWNEVFTMMDLEGKVGFNHAGWFSVELPCPGCCLGDTMSSGIVADLKLNFSHDRKESDGEVKLDKVSMGILSIVNWRYVSIENGLRYLQHFLVPCS